MNKNRFKYKGIIKRSQKKNPVLEEKQCPLLEELYIPLILRAFSAMLPYLHLHLVHVRIAVEAHKTRQIQISGCIQHRMVLHCDVVHTVSAHCRSPTTTPEHRPCGKLFNSQVNW